MRHFIYLTALFIFAGFPTLQASAETAEESVLKIQNSYASLKDVKGKFVQKNYMKDIGSTLSYSGNFIIKRPGRMKWIYKDQEILIKDGMVLLYDKSQKSAYKSRFDRSTFGTTPVALLEDFGDITKEFDITAKKGRLHLKPKNPMPGISFIEIEPSPDSTFPIKSFTIVDTSSNRIDILLKDVEPNTNIGDSEFTINLPQGVKPLEHNP